jgi:hypothetical protein
MAKEELRPLTPEEEADIDATLERIMGPKPIPRPKVITKDAEPVRDADVHVSRADVNAKGVDRAVEVRRADWVTVNMAAYEEEQRWKAEERERRRNGPNYVADRRLRKSLDPDRLGLYGPVDWEAE